MHDGPQLCSLADRGAVTVPGFFVFTATAISLPFGGAGGLMEGDIMVYKRNLRTGQGRYLCSSGRLQLVGGIEWSLLSRVSSG